MANNQKKMAKRIWNWYFIYQFHQRPFMSLNWYPVCLQNDHKQTKNGDSHAIWRQTIQTWRNMRHVTPFCLFRFLSFVLSNVCFWVCLPSICFLLFLICLSFMLLNLCMFLIFRLWLYPTCKKSTTDHSKDFISRFYWYYYSK